MKKKFLICFAVWGLLNIPSVFADDAQARNMIQEAQNQYDPDSTYAQERAFELFYDAYGVADSYALRKEIEDELQTVYRNYTTYVKDRIVPFLDYADEDRVSLYRKLAAYGDARGKRLHAIVGDMESAERGQLLYQAATAGDAEAALFMAFFNLHGGGEMGFDRNVGYAYNWLKYAAERNHALAWEKLAAIHWDGDANWNADWNQKYAAECLDRAIALYVRDSNLNNQELKSELEDYITSLRRIRINMQSFIGYASGNVMKDFYPTFLALRLSTYNEKEGGLRTRAYYINKFLCLFGRSHHVDRIPNIDLSLIPIRLSSSPSYWGLATHSRPSDDTVQLQIDVHAENMPYVKDETSRWNREVNINSTIAHEIAHCYFLRKYRAVRGENYPYYKQIVEGHATNVEYEFTKEVYFDNRMTPETFANMKSSEYAGYFRWYRNNCLSSDGYTDWAEIERHERAASPTGEGGKVRKQVSGKDGTFEAPIFFHKYSIYSWL